MGQGEDSAKKERIRDFLERVSNGLGYIEDIWVDRQLKSLSSGQSYSSGASFSGRQVETLGELLKDDISHTFDKGLFTFRFIAAVPGSGKTTTLEYLKELINTEDSLRNSSVVVNFAFNELLSEAGDESFGVKFYSLLFSQTLWNIFRVDNCEIDPQIKVAAKDFLFRISKNQQRVNQIEMNADEEIMFFNELNYFLSEIKVIFKKLFFGFLTYVSKRNPQISFAYLIDELDALYSHISYLQDARSVIRDLINHAISVQKIRLMVYIVGRQDDVHEFISDDEALNSRVSGSVINLVACRMDECGQIRAKIEDRLKDAYSGCKGFKQAWQEIQNIQLEVPHDFKTLREFCKKYAQRVIEIHEKHFRFFDKPFNRYESKARELVTAEACKRWSHLLGDSLTEDTKNRPLQNLNHREWSVYNGKNNYSVFVAKTTTSHKEHNLDCYIELRHNNQVVAQAYGEAKNYALIQEHLDTYFEWLEDFEYKQSSPDDLAFIVAPSCSDLKLRKLQKRLVAFIELSKLEEHTASKGTAKEDGSSKSIDSSTLIERERAPSSIAVQGININCSTIEEIYRTFKGSRVRKATLDEIFDKRTYSSLNDLFSKVQLTETTREKIEKKYRDSEITF